MTRVFLFIAYLATVPLANWMIGHVGTCIPDGPCLVPVGFGFMAPSGVIVAGFALVLRDLVQRAFGLGFSLLLVGIGTALAFVLAPPTLVVASVTAFFLSEMADALVYSPLQRKGLVLAVLASGAVGLVIDSAIFLWLAFGSFDHIQGQIVGKTWAILFGAACIALSRQRLGELKPKEGGE